MRSAREPQLAEEEEGIVLENECFLRFVMQGKRAKRDGRILSEV
jgi:hypothetical protein